MAFIRTLASTVSANNSHQYKLERSDSKHLRAMYDFRFTVCGKGTFPFDMLRYDRCYPVTPEFLDNGRIEEGTNGFRSVTLQCTANVGWQPTYERWRSFGWFVTSDITV